MSESTAGAGSSSRSKDEDKKLKLLPKNAKSMSTSAKRMQKELGDITLDPPPNCRYLLWFITFSMQKATEEMCSLIFECAV